MITPEQAGAPTVADSAEANRYELAIDIYLQRETRASKRVIYWDCSGVSRAVRAELIERYERHGWLVRIGSDRDGTSLIFEAKPSV